MSMSAVEQLASDRLHSERARAKQFAKMIASYEGWGMRIEIVPHDELHVRPKRRVKLPKQNSSVFRRRRA